MQIRKHPHTSIIIYQCERRYKFVKLREEYTRPTNSTHIYIDTCIQINKQRYIQIHIPTKTYADIHVSIQSINKKQILSLPHTHTHTHTYIHTHTHRYTHVYNYTYMHMHTSIRYKRYHWGHIHMRKKFLSYSLAYTYILPHKHKYIFSCNSLCQE